MYQYTADFSSSQFEFTFGNDVTEMESGAMQKELYDIEGNWIGYINFNLFTEEFSVVDQSGNPFVSTNYLSYSKQFKKPLNVAFFIYHLIKRAVLHQDDLFLISHSSY